MNLTATGDAHMSIERYYAVDHIEGITAVLVDDDGRKASVPIDRLPGGLAEGVVLRVTFEAENVPNWSRATIDQVETDRRIVEAQAALEELKKRDPGGDVET